MRVGIMGNKARLDDKGVIGRLAGFLESKGYGISVFENCEEIGGVEALVVLGGDGAILHAAAAAARKGIRVIGINYGTLGFPTEYGRAETQRVAELLSALEKGECSILRRSMLELRTGDRLFYALNEIAFQRDYMSGAQLVRLEVVRNGGESLEMLGDGTIICTPTGSTAYSLSAGGAILAPDAPVFMITPLYAFSFRSRATVFPDTDEFRVRAVRGRVAVFVDGKEVAAMEEGEEADVKKAPFTADFPVRGGSCFLNKIRTKLNQ